MFDKHPALIARCTGASDVRHAVNFAREHQLLTAVRAGGHSVSGKSTCDGGLVIDLQQMQGVRVDPETRRAYLESGSLLGQLDHESTALGLATTAGTFSITGAAGLTLSGGFGRLGRRFGLACDNVASFDVVTADGRFLRASDDENPDLFWGLRGGGGNFGVVTAIEYRLHPMNPVVLGGFVAWPVDQARDAARFYRDVAMDAPEDVNLIPAWYLGGRRTPYFGVERLLVRRPRRGRGVAEAAARLRQARRGHHQADALRPRSSRRRCLRARRHPLLRQERLRRRAHGRRHRPHVRRVPAHARAVRHVHGPLRRRLRARPARGDGLPAARHGVHPRHLERMADRRRRRRESREDARGLARARAAHPGLLHELRRHGSRGRARPRELRRQLRAAGRRSSRSTTRPTCSA